MLSVARVALVYFVAFLAWASNRQQRRRKLFEQSKTKPVDKAIKLFVLESWNLCPFTVRDFLKPWKTARHLTSVPEQEHGHVTTRAEAILESRRKFKVCMVLIFASS